MAYVLSRPDAEMLAFLYDDAFYYLIPAHSFAYGDGWSFDLITRTSGFQILYGYLAAAVARVAGYTLAFPTIMMVLSAAALLAGVWLILRWAGRLYGTSTSAVATVLTLATPSAFQQVTGGLEWAWLVLATALLVSALVDRYLLPSAIGAAAFVAVLTRVDLTIFIAIFTVITAWSLWLDRAATTSDVVRLVASAAAGSVAAVLLTGLNSWAITGEWVPNSVSTKQFWASSTPFLPAVTWQRLVAGTGPGLVLTELRAALGLRTAIAIGVFLSATVVCCVTEWRKGPARRALAIASTLAVLAYTLAYGRGTDVMGDHYSGAILIPVALLMCGMLSLARRYQTLLAAGFGVTAVILCVNGEWRAPGHLSVSLGAPGLFALVPPGGRVAAWNAGLAGWRTGKGVINLDGLANADVTRSIQSGRLACYLLEADVTHIMDYGFMFASQIDKEFSVDEAARRRMLMLRNGYDPQALYGCVTLVQSAADSEIRSQYRLFALDRECVARLCRAPESKGTDNTTYGSSTERHGRDCHRIEPRPRAG